MCLEAPRTARRLRTLVLLLLAGSVLPKPAAFAQQGPDLAVSDISFSVPPNPGVQTVATARLTNVGTRSSGEFNVKWFLDGVQVGYGRHLSLAAGQVSSGNVQFTWNVTSGDHVLRFDADVDREVDEEGEANNSYQVLVRNGGKVPLPDLFAYSLSYGTFQVGQQSVVTAGLRNAGSASSGSFNVKWFVDGAQLAYGGHSSLAPGQTSNDNVRFFWTPTSAGWHVVRFQADADGSVLESNETNDAIEVSVNVLPAQPDLVVSGISFSSPPTLGEQTMATASLRNAGQTASGAFNVKWFVDGALSGYGRHVSLAPGQTSSDNVHFTWTATPGTHSFRFEADVDGEVDELSEANNAAQVSVTTRLPDLLVDDISFSSPPTLGETTVATARLRNVGQAASGSFNIRWYLDGTVVGYGGHGSLAPGETSSGNVHFSFVATSGSHTLRYEADVDGDVPESNEGNNGFSRSFATRQADLLVDEIAFSSPPTLDQPVTATARLRNVGALASGEFNVRWLLDGVQVGYGRHLALAPGETSSGNVRFSWTPTAGSHTLRFEADVDHEVEESSESNNAFQTSFTTRQADLFTDAISFSVPPYAGQQTIATARLRNVGTAASGAFNVRWRVDGVEVAVGGHGSLAAGELSTGNVHLPWTPASPGIHRVRFEADVDGHVEELVETNNAFELEVKVGPLPELVVEDITLATPPVSGVATVASARLLNVGPAGASAFNVKWFVDGVQVGYGRHTPLAAGALSTDNVYFTWTPASAGVHTLRFEADVDAEIVEFDDANNAFQRSFDVAKNPVEVSFSPAGPLTRNADGWYSPNPVSVQVTLSCPTNAPVNCVAPFRLLGSSPNGARVYAYGTDPGPLVDIQCTIAGEGSEFSHHSFSGACVTLGSGVVELPPGGTRSVRFLVWVQPSNPATLEASATWGAWSGRASPLAIPQAAVHPLVFVHGILGAMPPQDKLVSNQEDARNVFDPFIGSYRPLLDNLQKMGYEWNRTLFGVAYDWRNTNRLSGGFLGQSLAASVRPNAAGVSYVAGFGRAQDVDVDLVVHSMGGLVSRAYLQDRALVPRAGAPGQFDPLPFAGDVNKVVFIASPHRGFPIDYRTREGLTWEDYLYNAPLAAGSSFPLTVAMDGIIWPGLVEKKYDPSDAELDRDCTWVPGGTVPGLVPYFLYFPRLRGSVIGVYQCTMDDIAPWAQDPTRGAQSLFEMLPTEDMPVYLVNEDGDPAIAPRDFPWGHEVNTFLADLNLNASLLVERLGHPALADNVYVLYGNGAATDDRYEVKPPPGLGRWRFGSAGPLEFTARENPQGDDLIPSFSTSMSGLVPLPADHVKGLDAAPVDGARHKEIMFHPEVQKRWLPRFLTGAEFPVHTPYVSPFVLLNAPKLLEVLSACPIDLLVIDPLGRRLGFDPVAGQVVREIPYAVYAGPGVEPQVILIADPLPGDYRITATGFGSGAYSIRVDQVGGAGPIPLAVFAGETAPDQQDEHALNVGANTPPGAVGDRYVLRPGLPLSVPAPGVLANDIELDGEALQATLVDGPAHGSLAVAPDGSFEYTPGPDFRASDSFSYKVSDGSFESSPVAVTISVRPPEVYAGPDASTSEGQALAFAASVSDDFPAGSHTLVWDFGDGTTATGTLTPTHAYARHGRFTVTLSATSPAGLTGSDSLVVTVANVAPSVEAGPDQAAPQGQPVAFAGSFVDPGTANAHTITWDFGDGSGTGGTLTPTHAYAIPGSYLVRLVVRDDGGGEGTDTLNVTISNVPPTVEAGPDLTVGPNEDVRFHGSFSDPGALDTHTIAWDFGDGATAADTLEPVHRYAAFGVYTVTLTVTDNHGGSGRDTLSVRVECPSAFVEDFEAYGPHADPAGWVDYAIDKGRRRLRPRDGFKTANAGGGVVFRGDEWSVSEYATDAARAWRDYEWTGRFRLPDDDHPGLGLVVYSDLLAGRAYHVSYHWSFRKDGFRAFEGEKGGLKGRTQSRFVPEPGRWHRFRVRVLSAAGQTLLRARFWRDGSAEPASWAIDAQDRRQPLDHGTIGLLSIGEGSAFDDLRVEALSSLSGISGDREGDAVCDNRDNCPATANPDQADRDGDGTGDACDACTAAFERRDLCLDAGFDARSGLSDHVVRLLGDVRHQRTDGACGASGFYRLGRGDGLVAELPPLPGPSRYRIQLKLRGHRRGDAVELQLLDRTLVIPLRAEECRDDDDDDDDDWTWSSAVTIDLPGGVHFATVKTRGHAPVDLEALRVEEVCAEDR